ncbi:hypothetical protein [Shewanella sp.]|uniref:hypothetical protein n=1 Tax=Shewanella sp. TaxID=50422 RepID=UPI003A97A6A3
MTRSRLTPCWVALCYVSALGANGATAADWQWDWQSGMTSNKAQTSRFFGDADSSNQWQSLLSLQLTEGNLRSTANLQYNRSLDGGGGIQHGSLSSLYWQQSLNEQANWEVTLGKVQLDWGVGYGYRPLDIFSDYQRHPVGIQVEQGAQLAMLTHFTANGTWQWLVSRSHYSSITPAQTQQGLGMRRYWFDGVNEWQALLYWDQQRHWLAGASLVTVIGDSLELHGSLLYQQQYVSPQLPAVNESTAPVTLQRQQHSWQTLFGFTWANRAGIQIIGEYWFDSRSWSKHDWQQAQTLAQLALDQAALNSAMPIDTRRNPARYGYGYRHANIMQHTMLLHWAANSRFWQQINDSLASFSTSIDLLFGPADGSVVLTPRMRYQLRDNSSSLALSLSWRYYGGRSDAAFANLGQQSVTWLGLTGRF